jgi:hypothetical protein
MLQSPFAKGDEKRSASRHSTRGIACASCGASGALPNLIALRGGSEIRNPARRHGPWADARPLRGPRAPNPGGQSVPLSPQQPYAFLPAPVAPDGRTPCHRGYRPGTGMNGNGACRRARFFVRGRSQRGQEGIRGRQERRLCRPVAGCPLGPSPSVGLRLPAPDKRVGTSSPCVRGASREAMAEAQDR